MFAQGSVQSERVGRFIYLRYSFRASVSPEVARERLMDYFRSIGYTPVAGAGEFVAQRGSLTRSMLVWEPRSMATRVEAHFTPQGDQTEIALTLTLDRTGHMVTGAEVETLRAELLESARFVAEGAADFDRLKRLNQRTRERVNLAIGLGIAVSIPLFVLLFLVVRPLLIDWGITGATRSWIMGGLSGALFGAMVWLFLRSMLRSASE
jgi:hypothetical protein